MEEFEKMAALELNEEALDEESTEPVEPAEHSGDLFAVEKAASTEEEPETAAEASNEDALETSTPTAEPSPEAAEAHASVERPHAEEIEVTP